MKNGIRRIISIVLIGLILFMQCGIAIAEDDTTNEQGAYLEIVDFQSEYTAGEGFNAVLRYYDVDGNVSDVHISKCEIIGFNSYVTSPEKQEITIRYLDCYAYCIVTVYPESDEPVGPSAGGSSGGGAGNLYENLIWVFNEETGELYVAGSGDMPDFENVLPPWEEYKHMVRMITIGGELTSISNSAFELCSETILVNIKAPIEIIHTDAFENCHNIRDIYLPESVRIVEEFAFRHCDFIEEIHYRGDINTWLEIERYDEYFNMGRAHYNCIDEPSYELEISEIWVDWFQEEYFIGEQLQVDLHGITPEGSKIHLFIDECSIEGFDSWTPGEQFVIIRYGDCETTITVRVIDDRPFEPGTISVENVKTEYEYGEDFYAEVYVYDDYGNPMQVDDFVVEGFDAWTPGEQVVRIVYNDYTAEFVVVVYEDETEEGINWRFDKETGELIIYGSGEIHDGYRPWTEYAEDIKMVTIRGNVTSIGSSTFVRCTNLTVVNIEAPVSIIKTNTFQGCQNIRRIYLPDTINLIDINAFVSSIQLRRVYYRGTADEWDCVVRNDQRVQTAKVFYDYEGKPSIVEDIKDMTVMVKQTEYNIGEQLNLDIRGHIEDFGQISLTIDECVVEGFDNQCPGEQYVTIRYGECSFDITVMVMGDTEPEPEPEPEPEETVSIQNVKLEYEYGEDFYAEVYVTGDDGNCFQVCDFGVEGFDSFAPGHQIVTVTYGDYSETFEVLVKELDEVVHIVSVEFEYIQSNYNYGEEFYAKVRVNMSDGTSFYTNDYIAEGFNNQEPGEQIVVLNYEGHTITVVVWVDEPEQPMPTVNVSIRNVKLEYEYGEDFYAEVYVISGGSSSTQVANYVVEGFDSYKPGKQTVRVGYENYFETFTVTVNYPVVDPETAPRVTVSTEKCLVGNTVDVVLSLSNNQGFSNLGLEIEYDNALTLVSVTPNRNVGATFTMAQNFDVYPFNFGWDSISNTDFNGGLVTLTFEVPEDTQPGEYFVDVNFYKGRNGDYIDGISVNYDENEIPLGLYYENGMITVYDYVPGDINGDGIVTNKDGTAILRYLAGWELDNLVVDALDVDGDGTVTNKDGTRLLRYLAGWDVEIY